VLLLNSDNVEPDGLGDGSALADSDDVSDLGSGESGGEMSGEVVMSLLESVVLLDVMEVISSEDDGSVHLGGQDDSLEDSSSNRDVGGEGALLVDVVSFDCSSGGFEA